MDQIKYKSKPSESAPTCIYAGRRGQYQLGFNLIELMVVLVIITILTVIAIPAYQQYARRADASKAEQEIQKISEQLERFKSKNFTYRCFDPKAVYGQIVDTTGSNKCKNNSPMVEVNLPNGATGSAIKYVITIMDLQDSSKKLTDDGTFGRGYAIKALSKDADKNYTYLLTSNGIRCKNKTSANVSYTGCGAAANGMEGW